jgi:hypothetical protein
LRTALTIDERPTANLDVVCSLTFPLLRQRYGLRHCALYALSLGMADDPLEEDELPCVYEGPRHIGAPS